MLSKQDMTLRGKAGAYAKLAKYGADHAPRAMYQGRVNKALAQVDAWAKDKGETLTDAERQRRADYLIASQNRANLMKANQTRQANARVKQIASPKAACVFCATERNRTLKPNETHRTCANHAQRSAVELSQLSIRASHLNGEA